MEKGFQIKTRFAGILTEHQHNLFIKNYSERMINSRAEPGYYLKQMQAAFQDVIVNNLWEYTIAAFQLEMTGHFGRTKDKVLFQFSYTYDPYNIRLNLVSLQATMNDQFEKTYPIKSHPSRDLPASAKVHEELAAIQKTALLRRIEELNPKRRTRKGPSR
jgi:hypothetical protein